MKNAKLGSTLQTVTAVSAIASILLLGGVMLYARQLRALQMQVTFINTTARPMIGALGADLVEYSKRNPAIDPILYSVGYKQAPNAAQRPATAK
jgi:hypothetical protein